MRYSHFGRAAFAAGLVLAPAWTTPASADGWADALAAEPPTWELGDWEARLSGFASGSAFARDEPSLAPGLVLRGSEDDFGVTGLSEVTLRLQKTFDSGVTLGARAQVLAYHDTLSGDRYGNDTFQKLYGYVSSAFGRIEAGQQDGAGAILGVTGPKVDDHVSLEDADTYFFQNPATGHRFDSFFYANTTAWSSANAAKINFVSTRLLGLQLGLSLTPDPVKTPPPFLNNPPDGPNQKFQWEAALTYTGFLTDDFAVDASLAYSKASLQNAPTGFADLYDWAAGAEAAYTISDLKFTAGGAYRQSNAYGFDTSVVLDGAETHLTHVSALAEWGPWRLGGEYSRGHADGPSGYADYKLEAWQAAAGYRVNDNLQLTAGWQWWNYDRDLGVFFNGGPTVDMNAGFVTLGYAL